MAIRSQIIQTPSTVLATQDIPNTALAKIAQVFPGTAAETAVAAQAFMLAALRNHVRETLRAQARATAAAAIPTAEATETASVDGAWPA